MLRVGRKYKTKFDNFYVLVNSVNTLLYLTILTDLFGPYRLTWTSEYMNPPVLFF